MTQQALDLNTKSMKLLQEGNSKLCYETLKQTEAVVLTLKKISNNNKLEVLTLNNYACYYKK